MRGMRLNKSHPFIVCLGLKYQESSIVYMH